MARPTRIDLAGGWYHVTSRGNERRAIFREDRDRKHFLELVGEMAAAHGVRVHAFVLMDNHFHLLLETPRANLSRAMQWLNVSYSVWFNRRHRRVGHLFQGRFTAVVLEAEEWALGLSRYVHLNPVRIARLGLDKGSQRVMRAGLAGAPDARVVRERVRRLRGYRWSSYRAYAGWERGPEWLECGTVLGWIGGRAGRRQRAAYRGYVEDAVREGLEESPWERLEAGMVLGGREFVGRMRERVKGDEKEQPSVRGLRARVGWERVVAAVEEVKGEEWEEFRDRHGDWGRDLALYLGRKRCGMRLGELGRAVGGIGYGSVSMAVKRMEERMQEDKTMRARKEKAEAQL